MIKASCVFMSPHIQGLGITNITVMDDYTTFVQLDTIKWKKWIKFNIHPVKLSMRVFSTKQKLNL